MISFMVPTPKGGANLSYGQIFVRTYCHYLASFSRKLHENEENWTEERWGGGRSRPKFYYVDPPLCAMSSYCKLTTQKYLQSPLTGSQERFGRVDWSVCRVHRPVQEERLRRLRLRLYELQCFL